MIKLVVEVYFIFTATYETKLVLYMNISYLGTMFIK